MHELSVCLSLLQQVEQIAAGKNATSVARIEIDVGPLAGVEPDLLKSAWPLAAAGTIAESALLIIKTGELTVECSSCGAQSTAVPNRLLCSACGDYRTRVVAGEEMTLVRLELDTRPASPVGGNVTAVS